MASLTTMALEDPGVNPHEEWHRVELAPNEMCRVPDEPFGMILEDVDATYFEDERDAMYAILTTEEV